MRVAVRREELVAVAAKLFRERGYAGTTVRDIAGALGVTSAALYHHVASKEDLRAEILDHAMTIAERRLEEALAPDVPLAEKLRRVIRHHALAVLDESQSAMAVFFQEIGLVRGTARAELDRRRARYQERFVSIFQEAAERGLIRTADPRVTAYGVLGMCNWLHRWYRPEGRLTPAEIGEHYADLVLQGLLRNGEPGAERLVEPARAPARAPLSAVGDA